MQLRQSSLEARFLKNNNRHQNLLKVGIGYYIMTHINIITPLEATSLIAKAFKTKMSTLHHKLQCKRISLENYLVLGKKRDIITWKMFHFVLLSRKSVLQTFIIIYDFCNIFIEQIWNWKDAWIQIFSPWIKFKEYRYRKWYMLYIYHRFSICLWHGTWIFDELSICFNFYIFNNHVSHYFLLWFTYFCLYAHLN